MSQFKDYFDVSYLALKPQSTALDTLLKDHDRFMLIAGDFFGIQKFIFDQLSTKNASKVLRAKSAYVQIFTKVAAYAVCDALGISKEQILTSNAGKFEILSPVVDESKIAELQQTMDTFFVRNFHGLSGMGISSVICSRDDFLDKKRYKTLRNSLADVIELKKFGKFNMIKETHKMTYDDSLDNQTLCKICNVRKITQENCDICNDFVKLGEQLTKHDMFYLAKNDGDINIFQNYFVGFGHAKGDVVETFDISKEGIKSDKHWAISSYVKSDAGKVADFTHLANQSCKNDDKGIKALGVLKGDVDNLGKYLRESDITESFENFELFSKALDNFFSVYVPKELMKEKYPNTYTVFAGGDDIFLIGAWDEIIKLGIEIEEEFKKFVKNKLSISMGIIVTKSSTPVSYLADISEEKLDDAKSIDAKKNAITLFNETVKWPGYVSQREEILALFDKHASLVDNTSFLYRLLEFIEMRKNIDAKPENSMWRSKLNYSFRRNVFERIKNNSEQTKEAESFFKAIYEMIEHHPHEAKMILSEFIYRRRDAA